MTVNSELANLFFDPVQEEVDISDDKLSVVAAISAVCIDNGSDSPRT